MESPGVAPPAAAGGMKSVSRGVGSPKDDARSGSPGMNLESRGVVALLLCCDLAGARARSSGASSLMGPSLIELSLIRLSLTGLSLMGLSLIGLSPLDGPPTAAGLAMAVPSGPGGPPAAGEPAPAAPFGLGGPLAAGGLATAGPSSSSTGATEAGQLPGSNPRAVGRLALVAGMSLQPYSPKRSSMYAAADIFSGRALLSRLLLMPVESAFQVIRSRNHLAIAANGSAGLSSSSLFRSPCIVPRTACFSRYSEADVTAACTKGSSNLGKQEGQTWPASGCHGGALPGSRRPSTTVALLPAMGMVRVVGRPVSSSKNALPSGTSKSSLKGFRPAGPAPNRNFSPPAPSRATGIWRRDFQARIESTAPSGAPSTLRTSTSSSAAPWTASITSEASSSPGGSGNADTDFKTSSWNWLAKKR
mmetsp:Transcript_96739/g.268932  ORF Transcript_96739/g.268932 Transcript_96739/m.268932 type:complete len:419 (-) Transcript_96739:563-1819(-)